MPNESPTPAMNCNDVRNAIYVYLDGEFALPEEKEFEHHLDGCPTCRGLAEREASYLRELRHRLRCPEAPGELRCRIEEALGACEPLTLVVEDAPPRSPQRARFVWPLAVGATLAASVIFALYWKGGEIAYPVMDQAVAAHQKDLPMEVRGSSEHIKRFLQDNVPFAVQIPFYNVEGVKLVGARLTENNGRSAVLFNFEVDGQRMSVLQTADAETNAPEVPLEKVQQGYRVLTFRDRGLTNSVVGDAGLPELHRLVPAAFRR